MIRSQTPCEQVVLVADVVVERHRLDADLAGDAPHRDGVEPFGVHHVRAASITRSTRESFASFVVRRGLLHGRPLRDDSRTFTRLRGERVDTLTAYAYPPYTVSIHRTSRRSSQGGSAMKINPETLARASSRHAWRTVGIWAVILVLGFGAFGRAVEQRPHDGLRLHEQPGGDQAQTLCSRSSSSRT
jgi:hypothetical protein